MVFFMVDGRWRNEILDHKAEDSRCVFVQIEHIVSFSVNENNGVGSIKLIDGSVLSIKPKDMGLLIAIIKDKGYITALGRKYLEDLANKQLTSE